jgi:hypothetical protein
MIFCGPLRGAPTTQAAPASRYVDIPFFVFLSLPDISLQSHYKSFMRTVREWRHVRLLKQRGCGLGPLGNLTMEAGSCAVLCPACPSPGINLPDEWENIPISEQ